MKTFLFDSENVLFGNNNTKVFSTHNFKKVWHQPKIIYNN